MQILNFNCKPTSQYYFEIKFLDVEFDWKYIYTLSRKITTDPYSQYFQYKILNNVLYLNDKLFFFFSFFENLKQNNVLFAMNIQKQ